MKLLTLGSNPIPLLVTLFVLASSSLPADPVDNEVLAGIQQLYDVQFDRAAGHFDRAIAADREDPRGYFFRANVHLWSYLFDRRESQLAAYMKASERAIVTAKKRLEKDPRDNTARLFLGMTYGYRAISNARSENIMAAALAAKTCYDQLSTVVGNDRRVVDAYLGLGIFHYIFGAIPDAAQVVVGMSGIRGDGALGLREIETVASKGTYFRTDARLISALLTIYHKNEIARGVQLLEGLARTYPRNVLLHYAIGTAVLDQGLPTRAIPHFERVVRENNPDFRTITALSQGRLGLAYYSRNEFRRAIAHLQTFLKTSDEKMFRAYAWYLLGVSNEMEGNRDLALKAYQRVATSPGLGPEDAMARRRAAALVRSPMTELDKLTLRSLNAAASSQFDLAQRLAGQILGAKATAAQRAQAQFALGQAKQGKGDYRGAIDAYMAAIRAPKHSETWVAPFSYYHAAECWLKLGDRTKYQEHINRASFIKGYDREPALRFKLNRDVTLID